MVLPEISMGRQLSLMDHCMLCLKDIGVLPRQYDHNTGKNLYERNGTQGFTPVARACYTCLQLLRGGNWPTEVYAKLSVDRKVEGERAAELLVPA
jgi:hypothetical protein